MKRIIPVRVLWSLIHVTVVGLIVGLPMAQRGYADVVIDFANLPNAYQFFGGGQNIGTYYSGVDFESNVTGVDLTGSTAFPPPNSGSIMAWDPVDTSVTISLTDPETTVGVWYTSLDPLTLDAFDGAGGTGDLLGSVVGAANTDGTTGTSDFISFSGNNIESVTLTGNPGNFFFDDVTFSQGTQNTVPEPSIMSSLTVVFLALAGMRWKDKRAQKL